MCEHSKKLIAPKLIAWMDGELPERDAAEVERHLRECAECRECVAAYEQASGAFEAYCDAVVEVAEEAQVAEEVARPILAETSPRAEGAARRGFLSRLKPCPDDGQVAENSVLRDDNKQKHGGLKPAATKTRRVLVAVAAAAAIAMVLLIPRHRVPQPPAASTGSSTTLHAVERPAERPENAESTEAAQNAGTRSETLPGAHIAKRTAPLAISTGVTHRHATGRPARPEDATGIARTQTAQNGQMRSAIAAERPQGESKPQTENAEAEETPIEIAVPTENMFPPGAVPPGIGFTAVVTISADDAAQSAGSRPHLAKFSNGGSR